MGKNGPCRHCGVTSTPLWRNGPPEKPVLCNACGSRWRTKGSLANYTPLHAREPLEWEEHKVAKIRSICLKAKEDKLQKRKRMNGIVENEHETTFCESEQNCIKIIEGDSGNRSSSGSAISYSESCADVYVADASDWTGSAQSNSQSNACDTMVPPPTKKKKVIHLKPSLEKLTKELYSIWHEQQSSNLSGSLEQELLFEGETPMGSVEIVNGGVLLRYSSSKAIEEESEASSLPFDNNLARDAYSRSASFTAFNETKRNGPDFACADKIKKSSVHVAQERAKRDKFSLENLSMLQDIDSPLRFTELEDIVSLKVFMEHMTDEERQLLMKYLPSIDTDKPPESLRSLFSSTQFLENLSYFQQLLEDGIFYLSFCQINVEECRTLKRLVLLNLTQSKWVEHYKELKDRKHGQINGVNKGDSKTNFLQHSMVKHIKGPHENQKQQFQDFKGSTSGPKKQYRHNVRSSSIRSLVLNTSQTGSKETLNEEACDEATCFSPMNLFASPHGSTLQPPDESSDQSLLLDVRCHASFPEAELLYHLPWDEKTSSNCSRVESCSATEEVSHCNFLASRFSA
ncbi:hypothetical protein HPP92_014494 [Vanilla planifolia]|uniref:GATA transcription factor 26 n=1 Tax=Vanilla planifolia TaxID=51239 RepID=A0A835QNE8_VANPL|nr:hypothetical protein HPP92_014875 [Vanilla planifolia]KAG0474808.1 hypothetical protein HPP92_014494 [Vanilla planifolia]